MDLSWATINSIPEEWETQAKLVPITHCLSVSVPSWNGERVHYPRIHLRFGTLFCQNTIPFLGVTHLSFPGQTYDLKLVN